MTRSQVAAKAGVSQTTVSYVLSGREDVGIPLSTRQRVLSAAAELGYTPNRAAQSLRTGQTQLVALWMSVLCPIYYAQVVDRVQTLLRKQGYEMMVTDTASHPDPLAHLERLAQWPVDGILAFDSGLYVQQFLQKYGRRRVPIVSMGVDVCPQVDTVLLNLRPGAEEAVRHLIASGRTRIAFVADPHGLERDEPRYEAYVRQVQAAGLEPEAIVVPTRSRRSAYEALTAYVREQGHPSAIFCYNDDLAIGTHRALLDLALRMPEDVALVGHDGTNDAEYLEPRLSSVLVPTEEMCETAWELLQARIALPDAPAQHRTLDTRLIVRASSGPPYVPSLSEEDVLETDAFDSSLVIRSQSHDAS